MSYNRYNAKVDENQPEIVLRLRQVGASVLLLHQVKNAFDILVGYRGEDYKMEIKNPEYVTKKNGKTGALTDGERKFMETWRGSTYHIVETVDEALRIIGAIE